MSTEQKDWRLHCLADGQWVVARRGEPGKKWPEHRIPREHHTEKAAERYALTYLQELRKLLADKPPAPEPGPAGPTIRSIAEKWEKLCEKNPKISEATRVQHETAMRLHVLAYPEVADVPVAELGPATLRAWVRKVRDHGKVVQKWETVDGRRVRKLLRPCTPVAPYTCRNITNSLTAFFADAMAEEWIDVPANPMAHEAVRREIPEGIGLAGRHCVVHLSRPIAERVLTSAKVPEWRRVRMLLALTSGMAEGELSGLRFDDLDLDAPIPLARVTKALVQKHVDGWASVGNTKTDNRVRDLPIHSQAARALRAWKSVGWSKWVGRAAKPSDPVFPNESGEAWRPDSAEMLRADLRGCDLPDTYQGHNFTAHATRRSFSTWLSEAGVEDSTADRLMGHAAGSVRERHYTAAILERLHKAVESIRLDLSTGQVIQLPMRAAAGAPESPQADGPTAETTATTTAGRGGSSDDPADFSGAGHEVRTRDLRLGKSRVQSAPKCRGTRHPRIPRLAAMARVQGGAPSVQQTPPAARGAVAWAEGPQ